MLLQPIVNLVEILSRKGVHHAIISPGSRNAPLTIALVRHPVIETWSISDERSAAFIALGMAQNLSKPVAICCTSGSAAYNYAPAVAEAFFQEVPLIILTADRPKEWIHQHDGQTIYQTDIFGKHVKQSFEIGADYSHPDAIWHIERTVNHAVNLANTFPKGPVHINIPLREPFYPLENEVVVSDGSVRVIERVETSNVLSNEVWANLLASIEQYDKVLIAGGQNEFDPDLTNILEKLQDEFNFPVVGDSISNLKFNVISNQDVFLQQDAENLAPELLITFGKSFISKSFKTFLRKNKAIEHWHLSLDNHLIDTFQSLTKILPVQPLYFFSKLLEEIDFSQFKNGDDEERSSDYLDAWKRNSFKANNYLEHFFLENFHQHQLNEFYAIKKLLDALPANSQLHLANSMSVRYANYIGTDPTKKIEIFANRGTSGIDGCVSTAVGAALTTTKRVYLLIGDLAFFYDRNALWNRYMPDNLNIILMNNHGGGIFRIIDGPSKQAELDDYFETVQSYTAEKTASEANLEYFNAKTVEEFHQLSIAFLQPNGKSKIFEIETDSKYNTEIFKKFKAGFAL
ncbi:MULTISPECIES: 2-succinyl-5-enolpyruvyl-6-hydroxy-3-cyclohexene-1-carboxylic-acid synthase [unclassified Arcicella]|uniref:2-succinyl-5-enolpyruvyl-6-hydroxy-3- cyclohexene-1-carboxylic-acid synthase n=1 Tax=unclassified Arcicella TaxID=2644986 RepID=UPI00285D6AB9|nr:MULTISPECIES: 2-succinyl-5-enolpyruvyl-6-hydroxy-3-cyclohexene-1-carboxylic-acid synthase [unclassified Arcicella]MDR6561748.1 2-succinyl-5-enolpyruvyl-6-hydroxy-3-cyclohexene-1-carboxylate synthase [Arcicella sp. BE51]MDR6812528.1 2-succinyl-5-enolpyruvyl-6-hydroxy-3-cyclohexene-1-carboxylate synthase [Arcicella sp. BE140]MDR6823700.1 2-succinyl-5-enolpyruvyl-6-hydroxy-3-cyclohexene-1-carboxylate synthase [Arcicella sp. BE139]